ncbi:MBG domain-containing protein [Leeuwenhoekiella sp. NPDC079379]|uniref:MBG domain-containing protein n=1 Tax=Leeuwenhoekiella sp. NPDC079379 TaxID=3364122 RepID=UPI0037C8C51C
MQKLLLTLLLITSYFGHNLNSQSLTAGDIAFIGYNTDINANGTQDHSFSWITLEDIFAGTVIYFTEEGWNANANIWYGSNEGHYSWTSSGYIPAGTIVYVYESGASDVLISSVGTMSGLLSGTGWNLLGGDNLFAYQSSTGVKPISPNFLSGLYGDDNFRHTTGCDDANNWFDCENCETVGQSCATTGGGTSGLPSTLTNGTNAIALFPSPFNETDNAKYNGTLTGTKAFVASAINNRNNWSFDDFTAYNITSGAYSTPNIIGASNTAPAIGGTTAGQTVNDNATINLFSGITIADADGDPVSATISLDNNSKGVITGASSGTGPYIITSRGAAAMQTALRSLSFNPTDNRSATSETTTFTVTVNDGTDNTINTTTTVISSAVAPTVSSIVVLGSPVNNATSVPFTVTFNENVSGVDVSDFTVDSSGTVTGSVASVTGSGTTYTITVNSVSGTGTVSIDLNSSGTGITDAGGKAISGGFTAGATHTVDTQAPVTPGAPNLVASFDSGTSNTDDITSITQPRFSGSVEPESTVKISSSVDGLVGTTTGRSGDGAYSYIITSTLSEGTHNITVTSTDAAGNESAPSSALAIVVDTSNPTFSSSSPLDNATGVDASGNITLTFNEKIVFGTGNIQVIDLTDGSNSFTINVASPGTQASISNTVLTINTSTNLDESANYAIQIAATAIDDIAGNSYAGITDNTTLNFTTADLTAPHITSIVRQNPTTNPTSVDQLVWDVTFSEPVNNVSTDDFTVTGTTATIASITNPSGTIYRLTVSGGDLEGLNGTVTLGFSGSQDITDVVGNSLTTTIPTGTNNNTFVVENKIPLTISGLIGDNKIYDATTTATASGTALLSGVIGGNDVSLSGTPVFTFASAEVGTGIAITTTGYTISGADAGNYTLTQPDLSADITTKEVTVTGITGDSKEYDGTITATVSGTALLSGGVGGDDVSLSSTPVFTFASADVGTGIAITTTGYTISGVDANNYRLTQPNLSADITTKALTITGITGDNKVYDGTTAATASGTASLIGLEITDDVSLGGTSVFTFASADVGTGILITITGYTISGVDANNYTLTQPNLSADITIKALTITGITGDNKVYDGTTAATASGTASLIGLEITDDISLGGTPVFTFASADVGTGIAITTTGYTLLGTDAGNYVLTQPNLSADITTKDLTITGITGDDKEYDGTTAATASGTALLSGVVGTDDINLGGTPVFTFASADIGTGIAITTTGYTISGADAGNYVLTQPNLSADITIKALTITGITGDNKVYDGTTAATASGTASLIGLEISDDVSLSGTPVFTFAGADAGTGITITTTGYTISGADAGNYVLTQPNLSADITTKDLTITGLTGDDKEYDATTTATASGTALPSGVLVTDDISLGGTPVFTFASADVGTGIAITTTGYTIFGADAGNYVLIQPNLSADITTKALTITGITGDNKVYDGTTAATASGTASLIGLEISDDVSLSGTPVFTFASADIGTGIAITTTGYIISGVDAGNYVLTQPGLSADITTKALTITGITGDNKVYDGTTAATASGTALLSGGVGGDDVSLSSTPVFTFASADVGTGIAITTTGYTLLGTDAGNYVLTQPNLSADITTKDLTITGITGDDKEYDGTTAATTSGTSLLSGVVGADDISLDGTPVFTFASADVGTGITIMTTGYTISGVDANNYTLTQPDLSADITAKTVTITGITGDNKVYDATTAATAFGTALLSGVIGADDISLGGTPVFTFASADVGTGITITTMGYTISGVDANNYTLTQPDLSADITTKEVTVTGITGDSKEYDGTTLATVSGTASLSGVVGVDDISLGGTPIFNFASANVGTGIAITTTGYTISGVDAVNYTLTQTSLSADINPLTLIVKADAQTKVYGSADPSLTYQVTSGSLIGGDSFSGSLTRINGEAVGTYEITQGSLGLSSNYDLSYISNDLIISRATITITADNQTKIYGETDPVLTVSYSGFENGDSETVLGGTLNISRISGEAVGDYVITASGANSSNYDITYVDGSFEITPAALTITADNQTKIYGEADPILTVSYSGFENGDSEVDLGGSLTVSRTSGEAVGSYEISASGATSSNYDITYVDGSFEITPAALTITADNQTKVYGEADPVFTVSYSGFVNGDSETDLGGTLNISRISGEAVGSYEISASGVTSSNYDITYIGGSFEITPAVLTITADNQTKVYGDEDPVLTVSYSGFVNGDSETDLGGTLNISRTSGEAVGDYVITASGATSTNYDITYDDGSFEITPASLTITADNQTKVYGDADPVLTVSYSGFVNGDFETDLGGTLNIRRTSGEAVGSYLITASGATSSNYDITYVDGSLAITPASLTITADNQTKVYGDEDPALTVSYSGFVNGDSETDLGGSLTVSRTFGEDVSSYVISASGATSTNYDIIYIAGSFEITPAVLTITADNQTKVYGDEDPVLTVSYSGFVNGDSETDLGGSLTVSRISGEAVGSYLITASGATSTNYDITYDDGSLAITPASLTITADNQTKVYGEADPVFTVSYSGFENGDSETNLGGTLNISRTSGEAVGDYVITASGATSTNYDITYDDGSFEITPASLTITADNQTKVYGDEDPVLTVSYSGFVNGDSETDLGGSLTVSRTSGEAVGSYLITASGATSSNYDIKYVDGSFMITKASQTISFNPLPVLNLGSDDDFQLQAEASSGLPITYTYTFTSDIPAAIVSASGFVNLVQSGSIIITASQSGNENYLPAIAVSRELMVNSASADITSLTIGDEEFTNPDSQIVYTIDCDETAQEFVVSYETEENAKSDFPKSFTVDVSKPGIYRYAITITSQDGSTSKTYSIEIHKRFLFEDIVEQKFNNTLLVNNNPATNGGYRFIAFTWYKNGNVVSNGQYFSEGDEASDRLDPLATYRVELTTEGGDILSTCAFTVELDISSKIRLAPNPVQANASTTLFANFEKEELNKMKISIMSLNGTLIDTFYTNSSKSSIQMPANIQAGVYILVCETSKQTQTIQFIVH